MNNDSKAWAEYINSLERLCDVLEESIDTDVKLRNSLANRIIDYKT